MPHIDEQSAIHFLGQLKEARLAASADSEMFDGIIHTLERLGSYLSRERLREPGRRRRDGTIPDGSLATYQSALAKLACRSVTANQKERKYKTDATPFFVLYELVMQGRNDALHQGAYARHLTTHAIELAIIVEDALSTYLKNVGNFMVRNPVCAELWQFVALVRQQMLANSYSHLPVWDGQNSWFFVSDSDIATFLGPSRTGEDRKRRLTSKLAEAQNDGLVLKRAQHIEDSAELKEALDHFSAGVPILLVFSCGRGPVGIVTPFDLL